MRIVLTGGGSGGHLVPFEPIIDKIRELHGELKKDLPKTIDRNEVELYYFGVLDEQAKEFFKRLDIKAIDIPSGKVRRYASALTFIDLFFRLPIGIVKSLVLLWRIMPDVVISRGGYGSIPVTIVSAFYRVPILLHESDAVASLTVRIMSGLASIVTVGFAETRHTMQFFSTKTIVTGTPVRSELNVINKEEARRMFDLSLEDKVLLVTGGSQGSQELNEILLEVLPSLLKDMVVIHITGSEQIKEITKKTNDMFARSGLRVRYKVFGYLSDKMPQALVSADLVVSRGGATALAELARLRKPAIIVPLDSAAQDHQRRNAAVYEKASAIRVIDPINLGRAIFEQNIRNLMNNPQVREVLSANISRLDYKNASNDIVRLVYKMMAGRLPQQPKYSDAAKANKKESLERKGENG